MLQKKRKYLCGCVYNIYIYIYTHTIYVFLLNVFLWDFNQNRDKQAFHINAFDHLQIFGISLSPSCSVIGKMHVCVHACECEALHASCPLWRSSPWWKSSLRLALGWFSIHSLARDTGNSLWFHWSAPGFFYLIFFFKQ